MFDSYVELSVNTERAFYLLPSRFWEIACGALLFKLHSRNKMLASLAIQQYLYLLIGTILVGLGFIFSNKQFFPFPWAILSVSGTILLISGMLNSSGNKTIIQHIFENQLFVQIGKLSYSLYLWHWPVYVLLRWTIGLESTFEISLAILISFILANISYYCIEKPIRTNKLIISHKNWHILLVGLSTIFISYLLSGMIFKSQPIISLSKTKYKEIWYPYKWPEKIRNDHLKIFSGKKYLL